MPSSPPPPSLLRRIGRAPLTTAAAAAAALAIAACEGASHDATAVGVSRADSAGVEIVTTAVDVPAPEWARLDSTPDLRIGTLDGPAPTRFGEVAGLVLRAAGGVIVAESQSRELRAFDASGTHLWTAGGSGEGPGEFARLTAVGPFRGDSVAVFDSRADRLTFVDPGGGIGRSVTLGWDDRPFRFTMSAGGTLLGRIFYVPDRENMPSEGDGGVFRRDSVRFRFAALDGSPAAALPGPVPDMEALVQVRTSAGFTAVEAMPSPWSRYAYGAAAPGGAWLAVSDRLELRRYDADGTLVRIVRATGMEREFTEADVEATRDALLADAETPLARRQVEERIAATPHPPTLPVFSGIRIDPAGRVWVLSWAPAEAPPGRAWVFEADGVFLGRVELPTGVRVDAVGTDLLWGVTFDAFDVPTVAAYRIRVMR